MKTILKSTCLFIGLAFLTLFVSCSEEEPESDPIVGTWKYYSFHEEYCDGSGFETNFVVGSCEEESRLTISSGGIFENIVWTHEDQSCVVEAEIEGSWTKDSEDVYTFTYEDEIEVYTVEFPDSDTMILITNEDCNSGESSFEVTFERV